MNFVILRCRDQTPMGAKKELHYFEGGGRLWDIAYKRK